MALTADVKDELARVEVEQDDGARSRAGDASCASPAACTSSPAASRSSPSSTPPQLARRVRKDLAELYGVRSEVSVISASGLRRTQPLPRARASTAARPSPARPACSTRAAARSAACRTGSPPAPARSSPPSGAARSSPHGSLTDPGRSAALEVTCPGNEAAMALVGAAGRLEDLGQGARGARRAPRRHPRRRGDQRDARAHGRRRRPSPTGRSCASAARCAPPPTAWSTSTTPTCAAPRRPPSPPAPASSARSRSSATRCPDHLRYAGELRLALPRREPRRARPPRRPADDEGCRGRPHPPPARDGRQARGRPRHSRHRRQPSAGLRRGLSGRQHPAIRRLTLTRLEKSPVVRDISRAGTPGKERING